MKLLGDNLSGDKVAFARNGFTERVQNGQRVWVRSPVDALDDQGVNCISPLYDAVLHVQTQHSHPPFLRMPQAFPFFLLFSA